MGFLKVGTLLGLGSLGLKVYGCKCWDPLGLGFRALKVGTLWRDLGGLFIGLSLLPFLRAPSQFAEDPCVSG